MTNSIRDLFIIAPIDVHAPISSGVTTYISNLILGLNRASPETQLTLLGLRYRNIEKKVRLPGKYRFVPVLSVEKTTPATRRLFLTRMLKYAMKLQLERNAIILAHRPDDMLPFVLFHRKNPSVVVLHGHHKHIYLYRSDIERIVYSNIERYVLKNVTWIVSVSREIAQAYCEKYPGLEKKLTVISPAINTAIFKPGERDRLRKQLGLGHNEKVVLFAGRLEKEKRLEFLIKIFARLSKKNRELKLIIIGDGNERKRLEAITRAQRLSNIVFRGWIPQSDIAAYMACADAFALCSKYEGVPTAALEALACGLPVVGLMLGDLPDIIKNEETGYLTDEKKFGSKLLYVTEHTDRFRANCIRAAQQFSIERFTQRFLEVVAKCNSKQSNLVVANSMY